MTNIPEIIVSRACGVSFPSFYCRKGNCTWIENTTEISNSLGTSPSNIVKFLSQQIGVQGMIEDDKIILAGRINPDDIMKSLIGFGKVV